jgi:hypothetical protein
VEEVKPPDELRDRGVMEVHIELADRDYNEEELIELRAFLQDNSGSGPLYLHVTEGGRRTMVKAATQLGIATDDRVIERIRTNPAVAAAWKE